MFPLLLTSALQCGLPKPFLWLPLTEPHSAKQDAKGFLRTSY